MIVIRSNDPDRFQLHIASEWDVKQQLRIAVRVDVLVKVETLVKRLEHFTAAIFHLFVERFEILKVDFLIEWILDAGLEWIVDVERFVGALFAVIVWMWHDGD